VREGGPSRCMFLHPVSGFVVVCRVGFLFCFVEVLFWVAIGLFLFRVGGGGGLVVRMELEGIYIF